MILDGRATAQHILDHLRQSIQSSQTTPTLAVILVGDNPASESYVRMKSKRCAEIGMNFILERLDVTTTQHELETRVRALSRDDTIDGIIVQAPLPPHLDIFPVIENIDPEKDVDGFSRAQIGNMFLGHDGLWSCTPKGIMTLLRAYHIDVTGKKVVILGRSNIVGKPLALMMINAGATLTSCNSHTSDITRYTHDADIVIVAIGKPRYLTREMVSPDSIIIDVGSNLQDNGKFCGDAEFDQLVDYVRAITPSPGGVGPMTIATLLENTWIAHEKKQRK